MPGAGYKYKFLNKEYEDSFALNVTETDFRQYDSALGRFNVIDPLSELAYDYTPYRYGFNNPVYWQDKTGLFESRGAAQEWIDTWGLTGANIYYNPHKGVYQIENNGVSFYQLGEDIISHMYSMDTGELLYTITRGAAASGGGSGAGPGGPGGANIGSNFADNWNNFNNNVLFPANSVAGIFETGAKRAGTTISTANAFNKKALAETLSAAKIAKIAGRVSMAGNISTMSQAAYQWNENRTWGNAARVVVQGSIIALEYGLNAWVPGLGLLVGVGLTALEAHYGQQFYDYIDGK